MKKGCRVPWQSCLKPTENQYNNNNAICCIYQYFLLASKHLFNILRNWWCKMIMFECYFRKFKVVVPPIWNLKRWVKTDKNSLITFYKSVSVHPFTTLIEIGKVKLEKSQRGKMSTQFNAVLIKHDISKANCPTLRKTDRWPTYAPPFTKVASVLFHVFPPGNTLKHLPCLSSSFDMWHSSLGSFPFHGYSSLGAQSMDACASMLVGVVKIVRWDVW